MIKKSSLLLTSLLLVAFLLNAVIAAAHGGSEGVIVRVTNYNPATYEYNFSCTVPNKTDASNIGSLKFYDIDPTPSFYTPRHSFLSPDNNVTWHLDPDNFYEEIHSNAMYHIYCEVQNFTAPKEKENLASEFHIDLRKTHNQKDPNIYVLDSEGTSATLKCDPPPGTKRYTMSWALRSREGIIVFPQLDNKNIVNITAPKATAGWDVVCDVFDKDKGKNFHWDMPIEFFETGPAYVPTIEGCVQNEPCTWAPNVNGVPINGNLIVNVTLNSTPAQADIFLNEIFKGATDSNGFLTIQGIIPGIYNLAVRKNGYNEISTLAPIAAGSTLYRNYPLSEIGAETVTNACYSTVFEIPSSCAGGIMTTDDVSSSCRLLICSNSTGNMKVLACNKPGNNAPEYFEMYKQSKNGSAIKQICLGQTCIKDEGYIRGSNFPVCTGNTSPQASFNGSLRVSTIPNFADIYLDNILKGNSGLIGSLTIDNIIPGMHQLLARKAEYNDNITQANVLAGELVDVQVKLSQAAQANNSASNTTQANTTTQSNTSSCFTNVQNIPANCTATITQDTPSGTCRTIECGSIPNSIKILACDKPDSGAKQYFEMYRQSAMGIPPKLCIGNSCIQNEGYVKSGNYPICTGTTAPPPSCTPAAETCNSKDDDCDGLIDENNICSPPINTTQNTTQGTCFSNVQNIPATCEGSITGDSIVGSCREINCNNGANSMQVKACDKPDGNNPQFFEMYRQSFGGNPLKICIGNSCIKNEGYVKSQSYPICTGTATNNTQPPPTTNNTQANTTQCFNSLQSVPAKCNGGTISEDTFSGCRTVACGAGTSSLKILACNKPDGTPQYFEMYKQNEAGTTQLEICLGTTCIKENGYAKSGNYPVCVNVTGTGTNSPPNAPIWLEPSTTIPIDTFDFHIHVFPMQDAENDTHAATDFEMYDAVTNERVWSAIHKTQILTHIHNADGNFEGNLANNDKHLLFNHDYKLRARFYENANGVEQASQWSEWRNFHTKTQSSGTANISSSLVNTSLGWAVRNGYGLQLVASGVSVPVNIVIAPDIYNHLSEGQRPLVYFTQLYGQVGMIRKDGTYVQYANNLLNYQSFGSLPGSGETGVDGIYANPSTGDLFVSMVYNDNSSATGYYGKVMRFFTNANGDGFTGTQTILSGIPVSPSHHVHQITRGPDGKLYMSIGDADSPFSAKNTGALSGKILRFNDDGSNPGDNPFGNLVWAAGFRNAFGTAWRPGTNEIFATNNGADSNDGIYRVTRGSIFGWCCDTAAGTWHLWPTTTAPVGAAFDAGSSGYPSDSTGSLYAGLSGSTYSQGPDNIAKRIMQFTLNPDGSKKSISDFVVYTGGGYSAPIGLAFGPDGLYFTDIYGEEGFTGVGQTKGNIYRVKFGASSSTGTGPSAFSTALGPARWYPKGLEMVWECKQSNGVGPFKYDFDFGDGQKQFNMDSYSTYHKYAAEGTYAASCTVHDQANGKTASAATTITLKHCTSADFQCG